MRGTLQGEAPYQDATAQKLFETLDLCANTGGHSRTYGALDPVQAATMAPKLTSIYVSGWQCSSTSSSSNEPGPDFADYPYDTVLTQRDFRTSTCVDGVVAMPPRVDGVFMIT